MPYAVRFSSKDLKEFYERNKEKLKNAERMEEVQQIFSEYVKKKGYKVASLPPPSFDPTDAIIILAMIICIYMTVGLLIFFLVIFFFMI
ncbi:MAG: hypothetical protein B6U95_00285 [Thermofilum sp. ex4484_82]|nr:MAG: hypothetical protein B6U95_00285 [Thermofilum sp. ex4484_82]OYT40168.1 MAG: hypothetical protein B6U96_00285 [Archaeoglobales archaeon ex4484_92]